MEPAPLNALTEALERVDRLCIDSAPVIYFIEQHPRYIELLDIVFQRIAAGAMIGVSSVITVTEVLTLPMKKGDARLQNGYIDLLLHAAGFMTVPIGSGVAIRAAALRARHAIRTPDALQLACAIEHGCHAFLTNDRGLRIVSEIRVIVLEDLVEGSIGPPR